MKKIYNAALLFITTFIFITFITSIGNCFSLFEDKDTISNLSFSHDGKKVLFDRCRDGSARYRSMIWKPENLPPINPPPTNAGQWRGNLMTERRWFFPSFPRKKSILI